MICWAGDSFPGASVPSSAHTVPGKTTFSLEFVWDGLKKKENIIYISLEEREERILAYMQQKGWDVKPFLNKSLYVIQLDPTDFNLANNRIKNELPKLIEEVKAQPGRHRSHLPL